MKLTDIRQTLDRNAYIVRIRFWYGLLNLKELSLLEIYTVSDTAHLRFLFSTSSSVVVFQFGPAHAWRD